MAFRARNQTRSLLITTAIPALSPRWFSRARRAPWRKPDWTRAISRLLSSRHSGGDTRTTTTLTRLRRTVIGAVAGTLRESHESLKGPAERTLTAPVSRLRDFNGDGRIDVVVGVPNEDVGTRANVGMVNILTAVHHPSPGGSAAAPTSRSSVSRKTLPASWTRPRLTTTLAGHSLPAI